MRNILTIGALVLALGIIAFLYQQLSAAETALKVAEQRFADCEIVTFQLQNQLAQQQKHAGAGVAPRPPQ
ncbi:hypothetical protein [Hymenobacter coccineus]|uniref:Uncharacterized protein n=1 Tax=Hymenobacter coccineus TaxID=1908235 RepID=A0A1G1TI82_9BACT|nr:hypothetical protein [Hymenobacter coccineus]OGX90573.1 hypothetical protein BEN49_22405 [Hymenobacter coccineus]